jgi:hypothetical protein
MGKKVQVTIINPSKAFTESLTDRFGTKNCQRRSFVRGGAEAFALVLSITAHGLLLINELRRLRTESKTQKVIAVIEKPDGTELNLTSATDVEIETISIDAPDT